MAEFVIPLAEKLALNPCEIEALCGVSARTVRELVARGDLKRVPFTSRVLVARAELDRWLTGDRGAA